MAELAQEMKDMIHKLQQRVTELEAKLAGKASGGESTDGMRMILIGPPGAGMRNQLQDHA